MNPITMLLMSLGVHKTLNSENKQQTFGKIVGGIIIALMGVVYFVYGIFMLNTRTFILTPLVVMVVITLYNHNT